MSGANLFTPTMTFIEISEELSSTSLDFFRYLSDCPVNLHLWCFSADALADSLHQFLWQLFAQDLHDRLNLLVSLVKLILNVLLRCSVPKTALLGWNLILKTFFRLLAIRQIDLLFKLLDFLMSSSGVRFQTAHVLELLLSASAALAENSLLLVGRGRSRIVAIRGGRCVWHGSLTRACEVFIVAFRNRWDRPKLSSLRW